MKGSSSTNFLSMPEAVISTILSLTSPKDICRSATVASIFRLVAEDDHLWEKFLPPDYKQIISRVFGWIDQLGRNVTYKMRNIFGSHREMRLSIGNGNPCLNQGKNDELTTGSNLFNFIYNMYGSYQNIDMPALVFSHGVQILAMVPTSWTKQTEIFADMCIISSNFIDRFLEVAKLRNVSCLDIHGKIDTRTLSQRTTYTAYLIVGFQKDLSGLSSTPTEVTVKIGNEVSTSMVLLCPDNTGISEWGTVDGEVRVPHQRADGWMEIELGDFYNEEGDDEVKIFVRNASSISKCGLIIEGVEVRPTILHKNQTDARLSVMKSTGKKCYMLSARALSITWGNNPRDWSWKPTPESRFSEAAEFRNISWLEIHGKINACLLSPKTTYAAYLVIKFADGAYGLDLIPTKMSVELGDRKCIGTAWLCGQQSRKQILEHLYFQNQMQVLKSRVIEGDEWLPEDREDGWMEIELGAFFINDGDEGEVKISLMEINGDHLKGGLIIEGIEVRPKL